MLWSITVFIVLPDSPMNAFFFTDTEKYYAIQRVAENKTGIINKKWKWDQALESIIDPKTWILFFFNIAINIPNGGMICNQQPRQMGASQANCYAPPMTRPPQFQQHHHQQPRLLRRRELTA